MRPEVFHKEQREKMPEQFRNYDVSWFVSLRGGCTGILPADYCVGCQSILAKFDVARCWKICQHRISSVQISVLVPFPRMSVCCWCCCRCVAALLLCQATRAFSIRITCFCCCCCFLFPSGKSSGRKCQKNLLWDAYEANLGFCLAKGSGHVFWIASYSPFWSPRYVCTMGYPHDISLLRD